MKSNHAGVSKVINSDGDYAFLMESNSIQYQIERMCDLIQVGGKVFRIYYLSSSLQVGQLLDSKGYGIAFTPGSHYRVPIDRAILQLQEEGKLHELKNRWWKERRGGGQCDTKVEWATDFLGTFQGIIMVKGGGFVAIFVVNNTHFFREVLV